MENYTIRAARPTDAAELLDIYAPYVLGTAITFEYTVPTVEEFQHRIEHTLQKYPYIVLVKNEEILGYAYTGPLKSRAAYDWSVETSIYVRQDAKGFGCGKKLYHALEEISKAQHICNMYACIAYPDIEDEYLTKSSMEFHQHMGYKLIGEFHNCGFKFKRWYNMIWMEKTISKHLNQPKPVIPFPMIEEQTLGIC